MILRQELVLTPSVFHVAADLVASHRLVVLAAVVLAGVLVAGPARADGMDPDEEAIVAEAASPRRERGVIEVWPTLDHHYRHDMVEPGWRLYQDPSGRYWQDRDQQDRDWQNRDWRGRDRSSGFDARSGGSSRNRGGGWSEPPPQVVPGIGPRRRDGW